MHSGSILVRSTCPIPCRLLSIMYIAPLSVICPAKESRIRHHTTSNAAPFVEEIRRTAMQGSATSNSTVELSPYAASDPVFLLLQGGRGGG